MTTTEIEQSKLNIHSLTEKQYEGLETVSETDLYIVDPQFNGNKFVGTDAAGNLIEKDALQGVQLNGTDLAITDNKVNIPAAAQNKLGVVATASNFGTAYSTALYLVKATNDEVTAKTHNYKPIVPANLELAVKTGVTANTLPLTDSEKQAASNWLGIGTAFVDWVETA